MTLAYAIKLGLKVWPTNIRAQKIDASSLKTFRMVIASFQIFDIFNRACFFQKTFLLVDISAEMVLEMLFWPSAMQMLNLQSKSSSKGLTSPPRLYQLLNE